MVRWGVDGEVEVISFWLAPRPAEAAAPNLTKSYTHDTAIEAAKNNVCVNSYARRTPPWYVLSPAAAKHLFTCSTAPNVR
jgi:hypothetical protein